VTRVKKAGRARRSRYSLRLYVTGNTARSARAVTNLRTVCEEYVSGRYQLEVIDVYQQPEEAIRGQLVAAPTLVRELPRPERRLVGDLSDKGKLVLTLELTPNRGSSRGRR
jgi:circadian clock protein KaiB